MKRIFSILALLILALPLAAQTTSVTATIQDSASVAWGNAKFQITWVGQGNPSTTSGQSFPLTVSGTANGSGVMSATVTDVAFIVPANSTWKVCITSAVSSPNTSCTNVAITGASQDISAQITAALIPPSVTGGPLATAYADSEVAAVFGNQYARLSDNTFRCYTTSWGACNNNIAGSAIWGQITGTLSNQTDLQTALNAKLNASGGATTGAITAPAFYPQSGSAGPYASYFNDFFTIAEVQTSAVGSASGDTCTGSNTNQDLNHPGNLKLTSGTGGANTGVACYILVAGQITSPNTAPGWTWESAVLIPVLPATTAGIYQTGVSAGIVTFSAWTTGVGFFLSSGNGVPNDWYINYNGTPVDTGVAATTGWVRLTMVQDGTKLHYYINGAEVGGTGIALASLPSGTAGLGWVSSAGSGTSVVMSVDYVTFQRNVTR